MKEVFYSYIETLQNQITSALESIDGCAQFEEDLWRRKEGGGGRTRILQNGGVFEKGGVNISRVFGPLPKAMQSYFKVEDVDFFACGLSLVMHPKNPMVPTVHANWRYFEMYNKNGELVDQWFGGGLDLTPYYLFEEDAKHFHLQCKNACDRHNRDFYQKYKQACDAYFYNSHRNQNLLDVQKINGVLCFFVFRLMLHLLDEMGLFLKLMEQVRLFIGIHYFMRM